MQPPIQNIGYSPIPSEVCTRCLVLQSNRSRGSIGLWAFGGNRSRRTARCVCMTVLPDQRGERPSIRSVRHLGFSSSGTISYIALLFSVLSILLSALVLPPWPSPELNRSLTAMPEALFPPLPPSPLFRPGGGVRPLSLAGRTCGGCRPPG